MWSQRSVIDYSLQRRATLATLFNGGATTMDDVCDADPYTLRAAKHHGEPAPAPCPVCRKPELRHLSYVFGDELGQFSGRIKSRPEIEAMAREHGEIRIYVLEVCQELRLEPPRRVLRRRRRRTPQGPSPPAHRRRRRLTRRSFPK